MQIVIDIPEETYYFIETHFRNENVVDKAIVNGTLLPKGHGRLIDVDALEEKVEKHRKMLKISRYDRDLILHYTDVEMAPAIIEADKEESEE